MISGLLPPSTGEILVEGEPVIKPHGNVGIVFALFSLTTLVALRWVDPPVTMVQVQRHIEAWVHHKPYSKRQQWTPLGRIAPDLQHAVVSAEDGRFWASGISLVAHMQSPRVPAAHFNTRMLITTKGWFGGGGDLTPMRLDTPEAIEDAANFHAAFQTACDRHDPAYYADFKAWCDRYFFLPHRGEPRGAGRGWIGPRPRASAQGECAVAGSWLRDQGRQTGDTCGRAHQRRVLDR
jgi:hypothetical protein